MVSKDNIKSPFDNMSPDFRASLIQSMQQAEYQTLGEYMDKSTTQKLDELGMWIKSYYPTLQTRAIDNAVNHMRDVVDALSNIDPRDCTEEAYETIQAAIEDLK